ncbi:MAG: hypothetical protein ACOCRK_10580 [bacterium]
MDFLKAIKSYQKDKYVIHKNYPGTYLSLIGDVWMLIDEKNNIEMPVIPELMLSDEWEVNKSKRTLWDKRKVPIVSGKNSDFEYLENDVKESLNEFIEWLVLEESKGKMINFEDRIRNKSKEIFGEELLK